VKSGDVVYLKSGGPAMTVLYIEESVYLVCSWFDVELKIQACRFIKDALTTEKPGK